MMKLYNYFQTVQHNRGPCHSISPTLNEKFSQEYKYLGRNIGQRQQTRINIFQTFKSLLSSVLLLHEIFMLFFNVVFKSSTTFLSKFGSSKKS